MNISLDNFNQLLN